MSVSNTVTLFSVAKTVLHSGMKSGMKSQSSSAASKKRAAAWSDQWLNNVRWQAIVVAVFAFALYAQTIPYEFAIDDKLVYSENKFVKQGFAGIWDILTTNSFQGNIDALEEKDKLSGGRYRPLSLVMFAVESQLFGHKPAPSHCINVLMNAALVALLLLLLRYLFDEHPVLRSYPAVPLLAVVLFAAHPTHTEVVANIKSRDEILCLLLCLGSLFYFVRYVRAGVVHDALWSAGLMFVGLFAKESAVTFLFLLPLSAYIFCAALYKKRLLTAWLLVFAVTVVFMVIRTSIVGFIDGRASESIFDNPFLRATTAERYATAVAVLLRYAASAVYPWMLTYDYSYNTIPIVGWTHPLVIVSVLVHGGLLWIAIAKLKERHILAFGIWWHIATISIVSNIVFGIGALMADRFLYVPSVGTSLVIVWFLVWLLVLRKQEAAIAARKRAWNLVYASVAILALVYSWRTVQRNKDWIDETTLVHADTRNAPEGLRHKRIYSGFLLKKAKTATDPQMMKAYLDSAYALAQFCIARDSTCDPKAWFYLGQYFSIFYNNYDSSIYYYARAMHLDPDDPVNKVYYVLNVGNKALTQGKVQEARRHYQSVLGYDVEKVTLLTNIALTFSNEKRYDSVLAYVQQAYKIEPQNPTLAQLVQVYSQPPEVIERLTAQQQQTTQATPATKQ